MHTAKEMKNAESLFKFGKPPVPEECEGWQTARELLKRKWMGKQ